MIETITGWLNPINWIIRVMKYIRRPQLGIYYDPKETYYKANDYGFNGRLGLFCHVMVKNKGKMVARNCVGDLKTIEKRINNTYEKIPSYVCVMRLKWAHEKDFTSKDIDPDVPRRLDVCYVHKGFDTIHFFTEKYPSGNTTDFLPGKYKIRIRVKGQNISTVEKDFLISYRAGEFNSLRIDNV